MRTPPHYALEHLSSTIMPSRAGTTPSVTAVESKPDKSFHPDPMHEEEHHDDVFKTVTAPASVTVVGDKRRPQTAELCTVASIFPKFC